jgi:hypothetical protein
VIPELPEFAAALDAAIADFAEALRESRRARRDDKLTTMTVRLQRELAQTRDPAKRSVLERLIAYGEATQHIARLVGVKRS